MKLKENELIPISKVFILENGEPITKDITELLKNKKVVLFGLPGAYTSVCSAKHLPGYVNSYEKYKAKGIDLIICNPLYKISATPSTIATELPTP